MNAYRSVIAGSLILALISILLFAVLNDTGATYLAAIELIVLIALDWISTMYVLRLVRRDRRRPRSWLLLFLLTGSFLMTFGLTLEAFVLTRRLFGFEALPTGVGVRILAIGLIASAYVPTMKAALFYLVQRDPTAARADRIEDEG